MSEKVKVVTFGPHGARILINPELSQYDSSLHIVNPDLSAVAGLSPHEWSLVDGKVVPAPLKEAEKRATSLGKNAYPPYRKGRYQFLVYIGLILVNAGITYLMLKGLK